VLLLVLEPEHVLGPDVLVLVIDYNVLVPVVRTSPPAAEVEIVF
jgi:hypothetical protein